MIDAHGLKEAIDVTTVMLKPLPLTQAAQRANAVTADQQQGVIGRDASREERHELVGAVS